MEALGEAVYARIARDQLDSIIAACLALLGHCQIEGGAG
jgi:hypothetical protein